MIFRMINSKLAIKTKNKKKERFNWLENMIVLLKSAKSNTRIWLHHNLQLEKLAADNHMQTSPEFIKSRKKKEQKHGGHKA